MDSEGIIRTAISRVWKKDSRAGKLRSGQTLERDGKRKRERGQFQRRTRDWGWVNTNWHSPVNLSAWEIPFRNFAIFLALWNVTVFGFQKEMTQVKGAGRSLRKESPYSESVCPWRNEFHKTFCGFTRQMINGRVPFTHCHIYLWNSNFSKPWWPPTPIHSS